MMIDEGITNKKKMLVVKVMSRFQKNTKKDNFRIFDCIMKNIKKYIYNKN